MKMSIVSRGLVALAIAALAAPAMAQLGPVALPSGEALPATWTIAGPVLPPPTNWSARVSYAVTSPVAGLYTYWYRVDQIGPGPLSPPTDTLHSISLAILPSEVEQVAGVYQFGQYEQSPPNAPGQSVGADLVSPGNTTIRWSDKGGVLNGMAQGEVQYVWLRSLAPAGLANFTLQNGTVAQTLVAAPAPIPEPATMMLVGLGLSALAGLRRKTA